MNTALLGYHRDVTQRLTGRPPFDEHLFLRDSLQELEESAKVTSDLLAVLEQDPSPQFADAIRLNRDHLHQTTAALERRYDRIERLQTDPLMIEEYRDQAFALIIELPISHYLASIRPGILLWRDGDTFHGPCPFIGHDFDEDSFRIYGDDFAWCKKCGGGNLFRVIGMVEALPSPHEQLQHAADIAGLELPETSRDTSQNRSFPNHVHRGTGRKERSNAGNAFQPIRIINGRVAS